MIGRVWHGWTSFDKAAEYERILRHEVFPGIEDLAVPGYRGIQLFRRDLETEVEFKTVMWFDSLDAVRRFAGEDYEKAYVPPEASAVLARFDERSQHYEIRDTRLY